MNRLISLLMLFFATPYAFAQIEIRPVEKIAVFPIADSSSEQLDEAWWQIREILTFENRFTVASRRLMMNRETFLPKKELKPSEAIILGKILEADLLLTTFSKNRNLEMRAFDTENGFLVWKASVEAQRSIPQSEQMMKLTADLIQKFLLELPYHGTVRNNEKTGKVVSTGARGQLFSRIFIGRNPRVQLGDQVQIVRLYSLGEGKPLFEGAQVEVNGEGTVVHIENEVAEIEFSRLSDVTKIRELDLVRIPKEIERSNRLRGDGPQLVNLSEEYLATELKSVDEQGSTSATASSLHWILSLAAFVLLAF